MRLSIASLEIEEKLVCNDWLGTPESQQDAIYVSIVLEVIYGEGILCWKPQVLFLPQNLSRSRNVGLSLAHLQVFPIPSKGNCTVTEHWQASAFKHLLITTYVRLQAASCKSPRSNDLLVAAIAKCTRTHQRRAMEPLPSARKPEV